MESLAARCFFQYEARSPVATEAQSGYECVDMQQLNALVERGRAVLRPVMLHSGEAPATPAAAACETHCYVSVKVREGSQGDVRQLPCGARSLVLDRRSGAILVRGVNKFVDLADVGTAWGDAMTSAAVWGRCQVWAQRKMAGFVVTLFSLDGKRLRLMSKHALDGPHVTIARRVLDARLSATQQAVMAAALFALDAAASCECIAAEDAAQHPVPEASEFAEQLVLFAVQKAHSVMELALPFTQTRTLAAGWGLTCVPHVALSCRNELDEVCDVVQHWRARYARFASCSAAGAALAEGFVLLIEDTIAANRTAECDAEAAAAMWCRPIRLKLKTVQYVTLRALRTSLTEGNAAVVPDEAHDGVAQDKAPRHAGAPLLPPPLFYHHVVHAWAAAASVDLASLVRTAGVHAVQMRLEQAVQATRHVHHRDAACSVGTAYERVCAIAVHEAAGRCALTAWLLCGLPGAGKTTLAQALVRRLSQADNADTLTDPTVKTHKEASDVRRFAFVLHLSRDAVARAVAAAHGIDAASSKHKQRRLRSLVHRAMLDKVREVVRYAYLCQAPGLLLLDACNASHEARAAWRRLLPRQLDDFCVIHVDCPDTAVALRRLTQRTDHELIADDANAQHALYVVRLKFCPPRSHDESCVYCDSTLHSAEQLASELLLVRRPCASCGHSPPTAVLGSETIGRATAELQAALLYSLLGTAQGLSMAGADTARVKRVRSHGRFIRVALGATTCATLWRLVADTLASQLAHARNDKDEAGPQDTDALSSLWRHPLRRLLRRCLPRVLSPLFASCDEGEGGDAVSATLVSGQTRWLAGWLQLPPERSSTTSTAIAHALHERFDDMPEAVQEAQHGGYVAHVTLFYTGNADECGIGDGMWEATGWQAGQSAEVFVHEVLVDRFAVCCAVTVQGYPGRTQWPCGATSTPLHVTLGTAPRTAARYAGEMFARFAQWQEWNGRLQAQRAAGTAVRSQAKFHNFVRLRLDVPLRVRGTLCDT